MPCPALSSERVGRARFWGVRFIHTHRAASCSRRRTSPTSPCSSSTWSPASSNGGGSRSWIHIGHLIPREGQVWDFIGPLPVPELELDFTAFITALEAEFVKERGTHYVTRAEGQQECVLVIVVPPRKTKNVDERIAEMKDLSYSAGLSVLDAVVQRPKEMHPKFLVGKGKIEEIAMACRQLGADMLVFDEELSPSQLNSISSLADLKVIDRNQLILDIFAARAKTNEARYRSSWPSSAISCPALPRKKAALSRLTGGIGGRGMGETKAGGRQEKDQGEALVPGEKARRRWGKGRERKREKRRRAGIPVVSIVGYTNSGKSTLLNLLTKSTVDVQERFFSTLNPTTRLIKYPARKRIVLTDTVGFIEDLPEVLLRAFVATLEELEDASLLRHLVDISFPDFEERIATVDRMIDRLGLSAKPRLLVFNKIDRVDARRAAQLRDRHGARAVSCLTKEGIGELVDAIEAAVEAAPSGRGKVLPFRERGV